jgi:hypothetical protein
MNQSIDGKPARPGAAPGVDREPLFQTLVAARRILKLGLRWLKAHPPDDLHYRGTDPAGYSLDPHLWFYTYLHALNRELFQFADQFDYADELRALIRSHAPLARALDYLDSVIIRHLCAPPHFSDRETLSVEEAELLVAEFEVAVEALADALADLRGEGGFLRESSTLTPVGVRKPEGRIDRQILETIRSVGHRLTTHALLAEMERRGCQPSEPYVKKRCSALVKGGRLTNERAARPPGYGLAEWSDGSLGSGTVPGTDIG